MGKRGVRHMGEMGVSGWRNQIPPRTASFSPRACRREQPACGGRLPRARASKTELNSEIWGKGVCDIWEKWVCLGGERKSLNEVNIESNSEIWGEWGATYGRNGLSGYLATRASRPRGRRSASARGTARGGHRGVDRRWSGCGARRRCERTAPHQTDTHRSPAPAAAAHAHCEETW